MALQGVFVVAVPYSVFSYFLKHLAHEKQNYLSKDILYNMLFWVGIISALRGLYSDSTRTLLGLYPDSTRTLPGLYSDPDFWLFYEKSTRTLLGLYPDSTRTLLGLYSDFLVESE